MPTIASTAHLTPAIRRMGELLASAEDGLGHLTCNEMQGAIDLLIAAGLSDVAADVIYSHAFGDDDTDDTHHKIYLAHTDDDCGDAYDMARELVATYERGEPVQKFRNLLPNGSVCEYATREARDEHAPHLARARVQPIVGMFWAADNPQDAVNEGWACDAVTKPTAKRLREIRLAQLRRALPAWFRRLTR
jgi:hypothetical protein